MTIWCPAGWNQSLDVAWALLNLFQTLFFITLIKASTILVGSLLLLSLTSAILAQIFNSSMTSSPHKAKYKLLEDEGCVWGGSLLQIPAYHPLAT